jgi:hypothetical protein
MAVVKISSLPVAAPLTGTEAIPVVQSATTVKTTPNDLATFLGSGSGSASKGFATAMAVALG